MPTSTASSNVETAPHLPAPARGGRPRSPEVDEAIREATLDLLARHGYSDLTMSAVAAQARVSTATLYRRWRSKAELVVDVLHARAEARPVPDTGSLEGDCRALLRSMVDAVRTTNLGLIMSALVCEIARNRELARAFRSVVVAPRRAAFAQVLERAEQRGELRRGLDYDLVADLLIGPMYNRLLVTGRPVTPAVADHLAELVLTAISAAPRPARPRGRAR